MPKLILLVGPPGSGKSTFAKDQIYNGGDHGLATVYVNQDAQGKLEHMEIYRRALYDGKDVIVDRMNFNKVQRLGYIEQARNFKFDGKSYEVDIHVFHEPYSVCLKRAIERKDHETIKDEYSARKAIQFFFKNYERVEDHEADKVIRRFPEGEKPSAIVCDLDGTLCNVEHRRHFVRGDKKRNWPAFFDGIKDDTVNKWCADILRSMVKNHKIVYCSGRSENERLITQRWLIRQELDTFCEGPYVLDTTELFMRLAGDSRQDAIVKEIILDFEILTRYTPYFMIDDRDQVVAMWRKRGYTCLQCDYGDF